LLLPAAAAELKRSAPAPPPPPPRHYTMTQRARNSIVTELQRSASTRERLANDRAQRMQRTRALRGVNIERCLAGAVNYAAGRRRWWCGRVTNAICQQLNV